MKMRNGIGPQNLGVPKDLVAPKGVSKMLSDKNPPKKTTNLPEVTVVGKKGKGLKETTEVGRGYSGAEYLAEQKRVRANTISDFKTKNRYAPGRKVSQENMDLYITPKVRKTLKETGYTERGVRKKSDNTRLTSEQESQYRRRVNPSNL
jgi:hypothetical protein